MIGKGNKIASIAESKRFLYTFVFLKKDFMYKRLSLIFILFFCLTQCTIQKRTVNKGYFVQWHIGKKRSSNLDKNTSVRNVEKLVEIDSSVCTNTRINSTVIFQNREELNKEQSNEKKLML